MLHEVYGDFCMSRARVFEWHKQFLEGKEGVKDDPNAGRPSASKTDVNIEKVCQLVYSDCWLTIDEIKIRITADELEIVKQTVRTILVKKLCVQKVYAKMVPLLLTTEQKSRCLDVCLDILKQLKANDKILERSSQETSHRFSDTIRDKA